MSLIIDIRGDDIIYKQENIGSDSAQWLDYCY